MAHGIPTTSLASAGVFVRDHPVLEVMLVAANSGRGLVSSIAAEHLMVGGAMRGQHVASASTLMPSTPEHTCCSSNGLLSPVGHKLGTPHSRNVEAPHLLSSNGWKCEIGYFRCCNILNVAIFINVMDVS